MSDLAIDWNAVPYFAGLNEAARRRIADAARLHHYQAGAVIFNEGDPCAGLFIIQDGMVRLYRANAEGRLHTLSLLRPPSTFNEVAAVDGGANPFNATAVTAAAAYVIAHPALLNLMASERALLANLVQALAHLNRDYLERLEDMTFRTIPSRLARLFLREASYDGQICEIPSQLTQEEIAAILGTTREVVGRAMRMLLNAGLLRKQGRAVYVVDQAGLEYLAETNTLRDPPPNRCPLPVEDTHSEPG
jgi:CRP/FNR family transcriptional regulator